MSRLLRLAFICSLCALYLVALYAVQHPNVSRAYREYFLDHSRTDWNPIRNDRTPEQGIDFHSAELPNFVEYRYGFSGRDSLGRWSDAAMSPAAGIVFAQPFSGNVCVNFKARPSSSQWKKHMTVLFGDERRDVLLNQLDEADYWLDFALSSPAKDLQFRFDGKIPRESNVDQGNPDHRRLGISVAYIRLFAGECAVARQRTQSSDPSE